MKNLGFINGFLFLICFGFIPLQTIAQTNIKIEQDPRIEELLKEKRRLNGDITINDAFKIQVFNGKKDLAENTLMDCKRKFKDLDGTIVYNNPTFKVWVGNFKTRIEAEKAKLEVIKYYPEALIIKANK